MAFVLTNKRKEYRHEYTNGLVLIHRGLEGEERDLFDKELAKIRNVSGVLKSYAKSEKGKALEKQADERFQKGLKKLLAQVSEALYTGWEGVVDDDKKPVEMTAEAKAAFIADPEAEKYWYTPIHNYLWPARKTEDDKGDDAIEVGDVDPKFSTSR